MRYGDLDFDVTILQWMNKKERDIEDCERDIDDSVKNLNIINEHNCAFQAEIYMVIKF